MSRQNLILSDDNLEPIVFAGFALLRKRILQFVHMLSQDLDRSFLKNDLDVFRRVEIQVDIDIDSQSRSYFVGLFVQTESVRVVRQPSLSTPSRSRGPP